MDGRRPLSIILLSKLLSVLEQVCFSPFEPVVFRSAFSVALFGALRIGEFKAPNKSSGSPLLFSHITVVNGSLKVFINKSKTDVSGHGHFITLYGSPNLHSYPLRHTQIYLPIKPLFCGSFFIHRDLTQLTRCEFSAVLFLPEKD